MKFVLQDNKIKFVKYVVSYRGEERDVFSDEELETLKVNLDEKKIAYTVETIDNTAENLAFNGITADTYEQALEKINGTYVEPETDIEVLQKAVLELASIISGGASNG